MQISKTETGKEIEDEKEKNAFETKESSFIWSRISDNQMEPNATPILDRRPKARHEVVRWREASTINTPVSSRVPPFQRIRAQASSFFFFSDDL